MVYVLCFSHRIVFLQPYLASPVPLPLNRGIHVSHMNWQVCKDLPSYRNCRIPFYSFNSIPCLCDAATNQFPFIPLNEYSRIIPNSVPNGRCTTAVSVVLLLLGVEKKAWQIISFHDQGDRQPTWLLMFTTLLPLVSVVPFKVASTTISLDRKPAIANA